jgi:hypothetical protein
MNVEPRELQLSSMDQLLLRDDYRFYCRALASLTYDRHTQGINRSE